VEFVRVNEPLWLGLTEAQLVSAALALGGAALMIYSEARRKKLTA
jgi:prolipoprotein diacylglyceryltransferase